MTRVAGAHSVGLTFDDGPGEALEHFLTLLDDYRASATFFLVGEQVERYPHAVAMIAGAGHEVAVHGYTHIGHLSRTPWEVAEDLRRTKALIEDQLGCPTTLYRPPYGLFSAGSWRESANQGWRRVLWSRWGRDWEENNNPEKVAKRIGRPQAGDILLLHDSDRYSAPGSWRNTLGSLPIILERMAADGLAARSVGELLREAAGACGRSTIT